ncbi:hypothetical protein GCM10010317_051620 [Streptomyces mirabilis]|uniref:hypothetical protein n=1 Tax=Streptomyces mirabilis TaxID=68239 RepID=UPI00167C7D86|nr:hypothetical protein [Streptomyces mirabilis]GHD60020.1 hypothetical protein GCM10010317_051620 [Streptomyces mirabilis]
MITDLGGFHFAQASDPQRISLYLASRGWFPQEDQGGTLWVSHDESYEAFVPRHRQMRGYLSYVRQLLKALSAAEGRSETQISLEISISDADVQYVHTDPDADPGTTPIDEGVKAFESLRQWVLAGAVSESADQPRLVQPARKPTKALEFMRTVRLGPTFEGSYILTVYIPVPPRIGQTEIEIDHPQIRLLSQPFERRVSLKLMEATREAVGAADDVIQRREGIDAFTRRAEKGVNANLCEAISGFTSREGGEARIDFSWALSRPVEPTEPISLNRDQVVVLREAAQEMRAAAPEDDVTVVGAVVRLHREGALGAGEISIAGIIEGGMNDRLRRVWLDLTEDDYSVATRAHESGATVSVTGSLIRRGNRYFLQNPSGFIVRPDVP